MRNFFTDLDTSYSKEVVVNFGNYLLSEERTNLVRSLPCQTPSDIEVSLLVVSDADVANFFGEDF